MSGLRLVLFGSFSCSFSGERAPEPVRGAIPQAVISRLALQPGTSLTTEALVDDLWADPPPTVVSSLRAHVSRLRSRGWSGLIVGGRSGYRLELDPDAIDLARYERLVAPDGGSSEAARRAALAEAERLWRGRPLASSDQFPFAPPAIERLRRLRLEASLELGELRIAAGEHAVVATALGDLVAEHADDERVASLLARALARSGRLSEAIDALDAHTGRRESAGAAPAPVVAEVRMAIVRQDPIVLGSGSNLDRAVERHGIPIPLTRFVGRRRELETVRRGRAASRLVTLTGAAGVGKTRLAVEVARSANADEDEAQRLIDLTTVAEPGQVLPTVADSVGASDHSVAAIAHVLGGRRALLILDNAEHVLGATAALCAALLERCAGLSVLVTSREAMRMAGERVVVVEPLVGDAAGDAVDLFLQRATDSSGIAAWSGEHVDAIRDVCATLDGLPLAIELAASRLDVLTIEELVTSLHAPNASAQAPGGRHDSIDDAIAWSVTLTSPGEREMLAQLAGFSGPFTLEAVSGICVAERGDPRELAVALARKSLVSTVASDSGERRFRVLEAVRRFVQRTFPIGEADAWQRRHAAWMTTYAESQSPRLRTREAKHAKAALASARADLDEACMRLIEWGDREGAVRLVAALAWYWYERGLGGDAVALIERVIAMPGRPMPDHEAGALRAATFMRAVGTDGLATVRATQRLVAVADRASDPAHPMLAHVMLAYVEATVGTVEDAESSLAVADTHRQRVPPESGWAIADELLIRGDALRQLGRPAQALEALSESYRLASDLGHVWAVKGACFVTGKVLISVNRPRDAVGILRTGAIRSLESEDPTSALAAVNVVASAYVRLDDADLAAELFGAVDALGERFGYHPEGSDGAYTEQAREAARRALTAPEWAAALERGRMLDLRAVMERLGPAT